MNKYGICFSVILLWIAISITGSPNTSFAKSEPQAKDAEKTITHTIQQSKLLTENRFGLLVSNEIDNKNTGATKYFSAKTDTQFFWLSLRNSDFNKVTSIRANRIELMQEDQVVGRANFIDSYSAIGEYTTQNLELFHSFQNTNGKNSVDIILYNGSAEVARVVDYEVFVYEEPAVSFVDPYQIGIENLRFGMTLELLNVDESKSVEIYAIDQAKNKITKIDKRIEDEYDEDVHVRTLEYGLSFIDREFLQEHAQYEIIVEVDGQIIQKKSNQDIFLAKDSYIGTTYFAQMNDLRYRGIGINLLQHNPYRLVIEQEGEMTKEIHDVEAVFNESTYGEEINVELLPDYFKEYGAPYTIKIYNANGEKKTEFNFLAKKDSVTEIDITDPLKGFKTFKKQENVKPLKTWKVKFNQAVDPKTVQKSNTYITDKMTGKSVDVNYELAKDGTLLEITPKTNLTSGSTYILFIDKRVKSDEGKPLNIPAAIEFNVE